MSNVPDFPPPMVDDLPVMAEPSNGQIDDSQSGQVDYFGVVDDVRHYLPDGKSWVSLKVFMEGDRRRFQNAVNKDVKISRNSGDMAMRLSPGEERHALLTMAITGWNFVRNGRPVQFTPRVLEEFLEVGNTTAIDAIEKKVREINPWLGNEMTVEDVDTEIARLEDLKRELKAKEATKS